LCANLQPRKLRGLESNGMNRGGRPSVRTIDSLLILTGFVEDVANGARLKMM
jgi:hypothetical protein